MQKTDDDAREAFRLASFGRIAQDDGTVYLWHAPVVVNGRAYGFTSRPALIPRVPEERTGEQVV